MRNKAQAVHAVIILTLAGLFFFDVLNPALSRLTHIIGDVMKVLP